MIVLWALFVLSAAVFTWAKLIQQDIQISGLANREQEARAMAHSGLALALHPAVTQKTPLLEEQIAADLGYKVRIIGEGGKLNLNWLLAGEEPRKMAILKTWLEKMELTFQEREVFIDCLLDYVDADDQKRLNGVEDFEDYHPANRPLESVDELLKVANSKPLTTKPGWRQQLTIYSQGPIDMTAVDKEILRVFGISDGNIERYLTYRRGKDGLDGTIDDPDIKSMNEVYSYLGLGPKQGADLLAALAILKDPTVNILSTGISGKVVRQVEVVARKGGSAYPPILSWTE